MNKISDQLNEDYHYQTFIIDFAFHNKRLDCDKLKRYLIRRSRDVVFIMTGNGRLTALVEDMESTKNILSNKIVNYFNTVEKKSKKMYDLTVLNIEELNHEPHNPFDYWLSQSIYLIEKRGEKWDYTFYIKYYNNDFINRIYSTGYIDYFRTSETHKNIQEYLQNKKAKREHKQNTELMKKEIDKNLFIKKINTLFGFTNNKSDYLSKRIVCCLLDLDYKCKGDIKRLNIILTDYGVGYDRKKMINRECGVFFNISLK